MEVARTDAARTTETTPVSVKDLRNLRETVDATIHDFERLIGMAIIWPEMACDVTEDDHRALRELAAVVSDSLRLFQSFAVDALAPAEAAEEAAQ